MDGSWRLLKGLLLCFSQYGMQRKFDVLQHAAEYTVTSLRPSCGETHFELGLVYKTLCTETSDSFKFEFLWSFIKGF